MRLIAVCLTALLLLIQYPLWLGRGGWLTVRKMDAQVDVAHKKIDELKARNAKLASEVRDLQEGTGAIEERARYELGMIRQNEIFIQVLDANGIAPGAAGEGEPGNAGAAPSPSLAPAPSAASAAANSAASAATAAHNRASTH